MVRPLLSESEHEESDVTPAAQKLLQLAYSEDVEKQLEVGPPLYPFMYGIWFEVQRSDVRRHAAYGRVVHAVHVTSLIVLMFANAIASIDRSKRNRGVNTRQ